MNAITFPEWDGSYVLWDGSVVEGFLGPVVALDTETTVVDLRKEVPELVLLTAYDGNRAVVVHNEDVGAFLGSIEDSVWVFHNAAFDYHVLRKHLLAAATSSTSSPACLLRGKASDNTLRDTMLLDMLVRLGEGKGEVDYTEGKFFARNLGQLGKACKATVEADKGSEYRTRFAELLAHPRGVWQDACLDPSHPLAGFFRYAVTDTVVTWQAFSVLRKRAEVISARHKIPLTSISSHGVLTEGLQVRASVALSDIGRTGLWVDADAASSYETALRQEHTKLLSLMECSCPGLVKRYKRRLGVDGNPLAKVTGKSGTPSVSQGVLREKLAGIARERGVAVPISEGKQGLVSLAADDWKELSTSSDFVSAYCRVTEIAKELAFFSAFHEVIEQDGKLYARLYPRYTTLVRTGRGSCSNPNAQNFPRDPLFRKLFVPPPGYLLYAVDYAAIELRTLAYLCLKKFGRSTLAEVIKSGKDCHCYTTAFFRGVPYEEVYEAVNDKSHPRHKEYKKDRQSSKALVFGVPGGLGVDALIDYAASSYGVNFTVEQARSLRDRLINEVYPELALYLADTSVEDVARSLALSRAEVSGLFDSVAAGKASMVATCLRKVLQGNAFRVDGEPYAESWVGKLWALAQLLVAMSPLEELCGEEVGKAAREACERQVPHPALERAMLRSTVVWPTGRVRAGCGYTQSKNGPFQGLAADGAKAALWKLFVKGYKVAGFVHDEVLVYLPDDDHATSSARDIDNVLVGEMEAVMEGLLPVAVEGNLGRFWDKG